MLKFNLALLIFISGNAFSQVFSGRVLESETKKPIPFASVYILDFEIGTQTNEKGEFEFNLKLPQKVKVKISAPFYETLFESLETDQKIDVFLSENHLELDEMVASSGQHESELKNVNSLEVRKMDELKSIPSTNLGEALATIPGVSISSTGGGISKPVIRGLQGNRVVTYLNGLRIENQQFGGDHGMGVNDLGINQVEIIKGPSSLQFGADALGGVLYFSDDNYAKQNTQEIEIQSVLESNTLGLNNRLEYKMSKKHVRFNLSSLYSNQADYKLPNGLFAGNSRFSEQNIKLALAFNQKNWITHVRYNFIKNRIGIPGHTHDSIIDVSEFKYNYQSRSQTIPAQLIQNQYLSVDSKYFFKKGELNLLLGRTLNNLIELEDKLTIPSINMNLTNSLYHLKYSYSFSQKLSILAGFQGMYQENLNDKFAEELLIPDGKTFDNGAYFISYLEHKKWNFQAGIRYDMRNLSSLKEFKGNDLLSKKYDNLNYSLGAVRNSKQTRFRLNFSNAYRTPHFSELLSNGTHHGSLRYEIGNRNSIPEIASQVDALFEYYTEHISLSINPFYNSIQNYIYVNPIDSFVGAYKVYKYEQEGNVQLFGADFGIHYHPHFAHYLHFESSYSFLKMESKQGNNLPQIPQNRINTFIKANFKMKGKIKIDQFVISHSYHFKQENIAFYETKSKAYNLVNASLKAKIETKNPFEIDFTVRNLLNEQYINHLSRLKDIELPNQGINLLLSLKWTIQSNLKNK